MEAIKINSGILKYPIEDEYGNQVATLLIDKNDNTLLNRILSLKEEAEAIGSDFQDQYDVIIGKAKDVAEEQMHDVIEAYNDAMLRLIDSTEKVFGEGIVRDIYAINYQLNPNFVPDLDALSALYDAFMPIVSEIFNKAPSTKYSPSNKGKKTRKEIVEGLKNE